MAEHDFSIINNLLIKWQIELNSIQDFNKESSFCLRFSSWFHSKDNTSELCTFVSFLKPNTSNWDFETYSHCPKNSKPLKFFSKSPKLLLPPDGIKGFDLLVRYGISFEILQIDQNEIKESLYSEVKLKLEKLNLRNNEFGILLSSKSKQITDQIRPCVDRKLKPIEINLSFDKEVKKKMEDSDNKLIEKIYNRGKKTREKNVLDTLSKIKILLDELK